MVPFPEGTVAVLRPVHTEPDHPLSVEESVIAMRALLMVFHQRYVSFN